MKLHILFGQRKQRHSGEFAPEVLDCWDEYSIDENHDGFIESIKNKKEIYGPSMENMRVIEVDVDSDIIYKLLNETPTVPGSITKDS
jgi:hypothetical protein